jgi:predicted signal transduction protein with EAL and GGDEF domain
MLSVTVRESVEQMAKSPRRAFQALNAAYQRRFIQAIWLICIILIAIVTSGTSYTIWSERKATIEQREREMTNLAVALAEHTSRYIAVMDLVLQAIQTNLKATSVDTTAAFRSRLSGSDVNDDLAKRLETLPGRNALLLFDRDGIQINSSRPGPLSTISALDRDYFAHFASHNDPGMYISAPAESRAIGTWTIFLARRVQGRDGQFLGIVVVAVDIGYLEEFYHTIFTNTGQAVTLLRSDGVVLVRNRGVETGVGAMMPVRSPWYGVVAANGGTYRSPGFFGAPPSIVAVRTLHDYPLVVDVVLSEKQGLAIWRSGAIWSALGTLLAVLTFVGLFLVISRQFRWQRRQSDQLRQMARSDGLTGLANRVVCVEAVERLIARARRNGKRFALLYLDLDHFKDVNDTLGHPVGDELLKLVAGRIKANVRETDTVALLVTSVRDLDTVARFGGDEFAVVAESVGEPDDAAVLAKRLLNVLAAPFMIQGYEVRVGASVGIELCGGDIELAETLFTHADIALYKAKEEGRRTFRFFTAEMDLEVRTRVALEGELRQAITENQLFLVYQPQIDMRSGFIIGLEALVRWRHPERGILAPDTFIPVAERSGLIVPLGHWVLREACLQAKAWLDAGLTPAMIGVNVSALQFNASAEVEAVITTVLSATGLPARLLELELTESVLMEASSHHSDILQRLRQMGIKIAIDDFGTGYSSLDYLRRFPVDRIKIAQIFVGGLATMPGNATIVKAAIGLARELDITVIAEGIETMEQFQLLKAWGCTQGQGFYIAKPASAAELSNLLHDGYIPSTQSTLVGLVD